MIKRKCKKIVASVLACGSLLMAMSNLNAEHIPGSGLWITDHWENPGSGGGSSSGSGNGSSSSSSSSSSSGSGTSSQGGSQQSGTGGGTSGSGAGTVSSGNNTGGSSSGSGNSSGGNTSGDSGESGNSSGTQKPSSGGYTAGSSGGSSYDYEAQRQNSLMQKLSDVKKCVSDLKNTLTSEGPGAAWNKTKQYIKSTWIYNKLSGKKPAGVSECEDSTIAESKVMEEAGSQLKTLEADPVVGDPVYVTGGNFYSSDVDSVAVYGVSKFEVSRRLVTGNYPNGSFGKNWFSSFDSRIIRGCDSSSISGMEQRASEFKTKFNISVNEIKSLGFNPYSYSEINEMSGQISRMDNCIQKARENAEKNPSLNAYVKFGYEDKIDKIDVNSLIYIDENGASHVFAYNSSTNDYEVVSGKKTMHIQEEDEDCLSVHYIDGTVKFFDKWGMPDKFQNRYGSELQFEYEECKENDSIRKLKSIKHNARNVFELEWNEDDCISVVKNIQRKEDVAYDYNEEKSLVRITDDEGDVYSFEYDESGDITKIIKPDGTFNEIKYYRDGNDGKKRVSSVKDESGATENFAGLFTQGTMTYIDADSNVYQYKFDENSNIIYEDTDKGYAVERSYSADGLVLTKKDPFGTVSYSYDDYGNLVKAVHPDSSVETWAYTQPYNLLTSYSNRDGVVTEYSYDEKGSLLTVRRDGIEIQKFEYNTSGNVVTAKGLLKENSYTYDYDTYAMTSDKSGRYFYDEKNRLAEIRDDEGRKWSFTYSDDRKYCSVETPSGLLVEETYNNRKDLIKRIQKDLKTGYSRVWRYVYDQRHLLCELWSGSGKNINEAESNCCLQRTVDYMPSGKIKSTILWNHGPAENQDAAGIKISYDYENGILSRVSESFVKSDGRKFGEVFYAKISEHYENGLLVKEITDSLGRKSSLYINEDGKIVRTENALGQSVEYGYSAAGLLQTLKNEAKGIMHYEWDDSVKKISSISNDANVLVSYVYNPDGKIAKTIGTDGFETEYEYEIYDDEKCVIEKNDYSKKIIREDSDGKIISYLVMDENDEAVIEQAADYFPDGSVLIRSGNVSHRYELDAWKQVTKNCDNGTSYVYDEFGRCIEVDDGKIKTQIYYNALGKVSLVKCGERFLKYFYDAKGNVLKCSDAMDVISEYKYNTESELIEKIERGGVRTSYERDGLGRVVKIFEAGEEILSIEYGLDSKTYTDASGAFWIESYDSYGRLISETNRFGKIRTVSYDDVNSKTFVKGFDGSKFTRTKSSSMNAVVTQYDNGKCEKIFFDALGSPSRVESGEVVNQFKYDNAHQMISARYLDVEQLNEFDSSGNRTGLFIGDMKNQFVYDKNNRIIEVNNPSFKKTLSYNDYGDIISIVDGNGASVKYGYDKSGRIKTVVHRDQYNRIIFAEGTVYGSDGKIICSVNQDGKITSYDYDNHGRVSKVQIPFSAEIENSANAELSECGKNVKSYAVDSLDVSSDCKNQCASLLVEMGLSSLLIDNAQNVWVESFEYDERGNRVKKTNPSGTMEYVYDAENRLVKILGPSPIEFAYDDNGNMLSRKSAHETSVWTYNECNRMISAQISGTKNVFSKYAYDGFGRRVSLQDSFGTDVSYFYDGTSFERIFERQEKQLSFDSELASVSQATQIRFRDIESMENLNAAQKLNDGRCSFDRYFVYADGHLLSQLNTRYSYDMNRCSTNDVFSFCTDMRGSVRSTLDMNGDMVYGINYDTSGTPFVSGKLWNGNIDSAKAAQIGADVAYVGKPYDYIEQTYNYGFREYNPRLARFTTEDPIRDGLNWYSYCAGDPVNFVDLLGLRIKPPAITTAMQFADPNWDNINASDSKPLCLGNSDFDYVYDSGCYANAMTGILKDLNGGFVTLRSVNADKTLFVENSSNFNTDEFVKRYDLEYDYWTSDNQGNLKSKIDYYDKASNDYYMIARVSYTENNDGHHWVGVKGPVVSVNGIDCIQISPTSIRDYAIEVEQNNSRPKNFWFTKDAEVYVDVDEVKEIRVFSKKKNK